MNRRNHALHDLRKARARANEIRAWWGHDPRVRASHIIESQQEVARLEKKLAKMPMPRGRVKS